MTLTPPGSRLDCPRDSGGVGTQRVRRHAADQDGHGDDHRDLRPDGDDGDAARRDETDEAAFQSPRRLGNAIVRRQHQGAEGHHKLPVRRERVLRFWKAQRQGDDALTAYSRVTKKSYPMSCTSATTVVCHAGDGGEVRFPMAAIRAYTAENAAHYAATHDTAPSTPADGGSAGTGNGNDSGSGGDCDPNYEGQCLDPSSPD
jgi:hypothetical protein